MRRALGLIALIASAPAAAQGAPDKPLVEHLRDGAAFEPAPDRAYALMRVPTPAKFVSFDLLLLRELDSAELDTFVRARSAAFAEAKTEADAKRNAVLAANARRAPGAKPKEVPEPLTLETFAFDYRAVTNVFRVEAGHSYAKTPAERVYLFALRPGRYVVLGTALNFTMLTCLCMGTIGFEARAGETVDMGEVLGNMAHRPSLFPELAGYDGLHVTHVGSPPQWAVTVRPFAPGMTVPASLAGSKLAPADYHAVGKIPNYFRTPVTRMAPVAGVLAYRDDHAIDVKSGREVP